MSERQDPRYVRVSLSKDEQIFMLNELRLSQDLTGQLQEGDGPLSELWITLDEAEDLRDQLFELVQLRGFDAEYRPTSVGRTAEELIDRLFTG